MPTISLSQGQRARVDWCDYRELSRFKWHAQWNRRTKSFYAARGTVVSKRHTTEGMHRRILGLSPGDKLQADHKNHDTLDNRRTNLRIVTNRENNENRRDQSKHGVGVSKDEHRHSRPFLSLAYINGLQINIGRYATAEEAREARKQFLQERI